VARKRKGDAVSGVLLLDKPAGASSNHALQQVKRLFNAAKAGHGGTLDPAATGLLPLLFGEATKFSADLLEADKGYDAWVQLGVRTDSADAQGAVIETRPVAVTRAQLDAAVSQFVGSIEQVPPMVSAIKRDGKPLYAYAREGVALARAPRRITIARLDVLAFEGERFRMIVECSKGTYVRTLAEDIGAVLGCGAHLAALSRTRVGTLPLDHAVSLPALEAMTPAQRQSALLPIDALLQGLPKIELGERQARLFSNGGQFDLGGEPGLKRVYGSANELLGTAEVDAQGVLNPRRLIAAAAD
jgi:tRNA pseudouridine55 synthase